MSALLVESKVAANVKLHNLSFGKYMTSFESGNFRARAKKGAAFRKN